ncbi:MAG: alternative ribosome rescue aminoacyl-tRNA hydrolase ArfB [Alphaproteobacteria bacterium]
MSGIDVDGRVLIAEDELEESFIQSSGPGGQNVNKVASAVQLRFDVAHSPALPEPVRQRLMRLAGRRLTQDGVLVITARRHRTQERNRAEARERLAELVRTALTPPAPRRPTRPSLSSKRRRLDQKRARSETKRDRGRPVED